ncbi:MAG: FHA domain-containing protein [Blastocatellia bacterium]
MKRLRRIYVFTLFGALGGLTGSLLHQHVLLNTLSQRLTQYDRLFYLALLGALVGIPISFFPNFSERLGNYSLPGAIRSGLIGAFWGGVGGMIALPLAEIIHRDLGGGYKGRPVAFALLGLAVGLSEGINGGARLWHGLTGGMFGGLAAGAVLELLLVSDSTYHISGIMALIIIGASIAFAISAFVTLLSNARLEGLPNCKFEGRVFQLAKFRNPAKAILGSDKRGPVFICIPDAEPVHAEITLTDRGALIRHTAARGETRINGRPIREYTLRDNDVIEIAHSKFLYKENRSFALSSARVDYTKKATA